MYDRTSPWRGAGQASAAQIQQWFLAHNPETPPTLGATVYAEAFAAELNPDLVAAQISEETGYWTSDWAVTHNNPAGLGVTGEPGVGLSFADLQLGIHAQCAHLLSYVLGAENPLRADDPRFDAMGPALLGTKQTVGDFGGGVWAVDPDYAAKLVDRANSLVTSLGVDMGNPTFADIGFPVTVRTARDLGPARNMSDIAWFIVHDTEGGNWPGDAEYLLHPDKTASAHAVIGPNGDLWFEVPLNVTAWTPGNDTVAQKSINVELSGHASQGFTEAQYQSLAAFFRWCVTQGMDVPATYVGKQDIPGICGHQDVADPGNANLWGGAGHHTDPGPKFDWAKLEQLIADGPSSAAPDEYLDDKTKKSVKLGFYQFWRSLDEQQLNLRLLGRPESDEFVAYVGGQEQAYTYQVFERAVLTWREGNEPPWDIYVCLSHEALAARDYATQNGLLWNAPSR